MCPNKGQKDSDIEWRWQWHKGWLHAQLTKDGPYKFVNTGNSKYK